MKSSYEFNGASAGWAATKLRDPLRGEPRENPPERRDTHHKTSNQGHGSINYVAR
jgi:hypothetical protein